MLRRRIRIGLTGIAILIGFGGLLAAQPTSAPDPSAVFFDDSVVHEIRLTVNSKDWQSLKDHFQENTYYPADFRWVDGNQVVRNVGIRSRGNGSRRPQKPSLRVDMNRYTEGQQFLSLKSIILRNNSQDTTTMRERISMLFFRRMGLPALREAHTRLFVNNDYAGLYSIVESPDKDFLERNFGEKEGHLYNYAFDDIGGLAGRPPFVFQDLGSDPASYVPSPFKPETATTDPQGEVIARFIQTINDTGPGWRQRIAEFLDVAKFIRHLAVENFLADQDGLTGDYGPNNFYFYRFENKNLFQFIPWDKSNTFWDTPAYSVFRNINDGPPDHHNKLVLRAFQEADLLQLYLDTLNECADSAKSVAAAQPSDPPFSQGWLEREVVREYNQIHAAALADTLVFSNADFEAAVVTLQAYARDRSAAVRAQVAAAQGR